MVKIIFKIASLFVVSILVVTMVFWKFRELDNPQHAFLKGRFLKQKRLASTVHPRVILCGGSNLAFGIDSELMEEKTGLTVVNMGLQRGLGLPYMLQELEANIRDNDLVIFSLEFDYYYQKQLDGFTPLFLVENDVENMHYFQNQTDVNRMLNFMPRFLQIKMNVLLFGGKTTQSLIYNENAFNAYGDVISHLEMEKPVSSPVCEVFELDYNTDNLALLNEFSEKHPRVNFHTVFPSFLKSTYELHQDEIIELFHHLEEQSHLELLGESNSFVFSDAYFFDSVYHLNATGRKVRSEKLARLINSL